MAGCASRGSCTSHREIAEKNRGDEREVVASLRKVHGDAKETRPRMVRWVTDPFSPQALLSPTTATPVSPSRYLPPLSTTAPTEGIDCSWAVQPTMVPKRTGQERGWKCSTHAQEQFMGGGGEEGANMGGHQEEKKRGVIDDGAKADWARAIEEAQRRSRGKEESVVGAWGSM